MLTNRYVIAVFIPFALLACGALLKKIVRGGGWQKRDFFLGAELSLSAIGSAMVYLYDLRGQFTPLATDRLWSQIAATASFMVISFFLLLFIMSTHQDWEQKTGNPKGQVIWL